ncbi:MAG TPA: hypothetical protein VFZ59_25045 [Verrucomicrobiae bacterium]|nr:hypothetical protein [Verrucomicrobiae bacterium]
MREPSVGKENLGAVIGAVIGAVGGLFAIAIPLAIMTGNVQMLSIARRLGLFGFLISVPVGWFAGGYLSHALEKKLSRKAAGIVGGIIGGLLPVTAIALLGWYLVS